MKSYTIWLEMQTPIPSRVNEVIVAENPPDVEYPPFQQQMVVNIPGYKTIKFITVRPNKVLVMINVNKLNSLWKKDFKGYYIPPGVSETEERCIRVRQYLETGQPLAAPEISIGNLKQTFHDGRHRFAVLRDVGAKQIPIAVNLKYAKQIQIEFGR